MEWFIFHYKIGMNNKGVVTIFALKKTLLFLNVTARPVFIFQSSMNAAPMAIPSTTLSL